MIVEKEMNHSHYVRLLIGLGTLCCLMGGGQTALAAPPPDADMVAGQDAGAQLSSAVHSRNAWVQVRRKVWIRRPLRRRRKRGRCTSFCMA